MAALIADSGFADFYRFRQGASPRASSEIMDPARWRVFDRPQLVDRYTRAVKPDLRELRLGVEGVSCGACVWLLEEGLSRVQGIGAVSVNPVSRDALIQFDPQRIRSSDVLAAVAALGFEPRPRIGSGAKVRGVAETRAELKRLAVAGLGFVQIMTLSAALYLGAFQNMDATFVDFFTLVSMLVATPVVIYAGAPIFRAAWAQLRHWHPGMDLTVALAIGAALSASLLNVFRAQGATYFDSVTMFVFFLTLGRFLETRARQQVGSEIDELAALLPAVALRRRGQGLERVGSVELEAGDHVVVQPGGSVPADGRLLSARAALDESLTSGESTARWRSVGEPIVGGSINAGEQAIEIEVSEAGGAGYVGRVADLLSRALADRPQFVRAADRWARVFITAVLAATAVSGLLWWYFEPARAFDVVLAMLVVTCPCALSLATPTALAVALNALARRGLLLGSSRTLERLGTVTHWLFDKTGTLTTGSVQVSRVETFADLNEAQCLEIAAALEAGVDHPIARAFSRDAHAVAPVKVEHRAGFGVEGVIAGRRYRLGSNRYVAASVTDSDTSAVYLGDSERLLARFTLADALRPSAAQALAQLTREGYRLVLASGDQAGPVAAVARRLGITDYWSAQQPQDKLALLADLRRQGAVVAAVGDGINDAPLLGGADVSIAMVQGSRLAQASADIVFTSENLTTLAELPGYARSTRRVIRQNLAWAVGYNVVALSVAAGGLLTPWLAALGMSASSLVVVLNALRLKGLINPSTRLAGSAEPLALKLEHSAS